MFRIMTLFPGGNWRARCELDATESAKRREGILAPTMILVLSRFSTVNNLKSKEAHHCMRSVQFKLPRPRRRFIRTPSEVSHWKIFLEMRSLKLHCIDWEPSRFSGLE